MDALVDDTIRLEPLTAEHASAMDEIARDDDVVRFTRLPDPVPAGFGAVWVDRYVRGRAAGENAGFAIHDAATADVIGFIALVTLDAGAAEAEAGYIVASRARGRGVGARALRLLSDWAFDELGLERIELRIDVANPASERVAERAGYTCEGVLRRVYVKPGVRADQTVFSRLRTDA